MTKKPVKKPTKKTIKKPAAKKAVSDYVSDKVFNGTRPVTGLRLESLKKKRTKEKTPKKTFTITTFTEQGARTLRKTYERAGYVFVKSEVTEHQVFLTFEDTMDP